MTHLTFGRDFNKPIEVLPHNLTHLTFGRDFNKPIGGILPPNLTHLTFGDDFNQPIEGFWLNQRYYNSKKFDYSVVKAKWKNFKKDYPRSKLCCIIC